jgi:transposase
MLEFLPPYSLDFNPIEYSFSVIKRFLKADDCINGDETDEEFAKKIVNAAKLVITPTIARNQFRHCGIRVD